MLVNVMIFVFGAFCGAMLMASIRQSSAAPAPAVEDDLLIELEIEAE